MQTKSNEKQEAEASSWACLLPTLLMRLLAEHEQPTRRQIGDAIEKRLVQAELGDKLQLLSDYVQEHLEEQLRSLEVT